MKFLFVFLLTILSLFANIATVVDNVGSSQLLRDGKSILVVKKQKLKEHDTIKTGKNAKVKIFFKDNTAVSLGQNTIFEIDSYIFTGKKDSHIKFKVLKGFFKTVTGRISKVAPSRFKLQTKNATIGIRGTVFAANVGDSVDVVICTDGTIVLFTPNGDVEVSSGKIGRTKKGVKPNVKEYSEKEKEELIKKAGWHGSMSLKELITYIKANFKEPLRSQLLATLQNILNKDSDERKKYRGKPKTKNVDDKSFVDSITINDREFDELPNDVEFYPEDLKDGKVIVQGILESEDKALSVNSLYVEITTDGGESWSRAKGHSEWEWSFTPELEKSYEFSLRVVMEEELDNAPIVIAGAGLVKQEFQKPDKKMPILVKQKEFTPKVITTEPIVLKFKKFTAKVITTEPIVLKFKKFTPKIITTEPIVLKFKKFIPKVITTEPIVLKFKKFTPKVITTEPIVLKFKKFTPKVITTEPIVLKFKKFTAKVITTEPIVLKFKKFMPKLITTEPIIVRFKVSSRNNMQKMVPEVKEYKSNMSKKNYKLDREIPKAKQYKDQKQSSKHQVGGKAPQAKEFNGRKEEGVHFDKTRIPVEHKKIDKEHLPGTHGSDVPSGGTRGGINLPDYNKHIDVDAHTGVDRQNPGSFDGIAPASSGMRDGMFGQEAADWESEAGSNHHGWNGMNSQAKYYQMVGAGDVASHMAGKDTLDWEKKNGFHNSKYMEDTMTNTHVHASSYLKEGEKLSHNSDGDDSSSDNNKDKDKKKEKKQDKKKKEKQDSDDKKSYGLGGEAGGGGHVDPSDGGYAPVHMTGKQAAAVGKVQGLMKNGVGYVGGKAGGSGDGRVDKGDEGNGVVVVGGGGQDNPNNNPDDGQLHYSGSSVAGGKVKVTKKEQAGGNVHVSDH